MSNEAHNPASCQTAVRRRALMQKARTTYGLGFSNMSRVLGLGINQWRLYENGEADPNASNGYLIDIACRPTGMKRLLELCPPVTREDMGKRWHNAYNKVETIVKEIERKGEDLKRQLDAEYFNDAEKLPCA